MKILAVDSSSATYSVALYRDGEQTELVQPVSPGASRDLLGLVERLLREQDTPLAALDAVAYGRGPGSFTGLRIASSVIQGLSFARQLPVIAISSLAALAQQAEGDRLFVAMDARIGEVYCGFYERGIDGCVSLMGQSTEGVFKPENVPCPPVPDGPWSGAGTGWGLYADSLLKALMTPPEQVWPQMEPCATGILTLALKAFREGRWVDAQGALPVYVRNHVADPPKKPGK